SPTVAGWFRSRKTILVMAGEKREARLRARRPGHHGGTRYVANHYPRHAWACPGLSRASTFLKVRAWMAGTSPRSKASSPRPAMTEREQQANKKGIRPHAIHPVRSHRQSSCYHRLQPRHRPFLGGAFGKAWRQGGDFQPQG